MAAWRECPRDRSQQWWRFPERKSNVDTLGGEPPAADALTTLEVRPRDGAVAGAAAERRGSFVLAVDRQNSPLPGMGDGPEPGSSVIARQLWSEAVKRGRFFSLAGARNEPAASVRIRLSSPEARKRAVHLLAPGGRSYRGVIRGEVGWLFVARERHSTEQ